MFYTSWCTTGLHVGHACPSRHVNMQISEDTCEDVCVPQKTSVKASPGPDPRIRRRIQIGMFRPIRVDHTKCLQVSIKTHSSSQGIRTARKFLGPFAGHSENVRYEGIAVDLPPDVTSCSNNRRENIFSVDQHRENPR